MLQLEKYRGSRSRFACPACNSKKQFARYVDDSGEYIDETVGRCNRESSCGYHLTPKEYFSSRSVQCSTFEHLSKLNAPNKMNELNTLNTLNTLNAFEQFQTIDNSFVVRSLVHNGINRFLLFLESFIDAQLVFEMARRYFIGSTKTGKTCFWQIDRKGRARTGKIISYDAATGKRSRSVNPNWIHYELKRAGALPESFQHQLCFFGEHLLRTEKQKPIAIVEAEKTAAIASIFIDDFVWLGVGGKSHLKADKLRRFGTRKIVLFPDADGFDLWEREAADARAARMDVTTSRIIEDTATSEEKKSGFDLADYLTRSERHASVWNARADSYNEKVERVKADESLFDCFNEMIDERIAIAETENLQAEDYRTIVEYVC